MTKGQARKTLPPLVRQTIIVAWSTLLIGLLLGSFAGPGALALRDMVVLDHPMLTPSALGFGDLPARNYPQDGFLALVGHVLPASWLVRAWLLAAAIFAAYGAALLSNPAPATARNTATARSTAGTATAGTAGTLAAITLALWNPLVVERLLQGHWSLVTAIWALTLLAALNLRNHRVSVILLLWFCSLTPTGAVLGITVSVVTARTLRRRLGMALVGALLSLPWALPSLVALPGSVLALLGDAALGASTTLAAGASVFAPRAETYAGTLGSLLGLGGIWNGDAVPPSREAGLALAGVVLFLVLIPMWRRIPRSLLTLAVLGLGIPILCWLLPELLGWALTHWTGAGLFRDSHKFLGLALPAYVAAASRLPKLWPWVALALTLLQLPDAPAALRQLTPVTVEIPHLETSGRDVFDPQLSTVLSNQDRVLVNPITKAYSIVESGALSVDGIPVDRPSPRFAAAQKAWSQGDVEELRCLGIGLVVDGQQVLADTGAPARSLTPGLLLLGCWFLIPVVTLGAAARAVARGYWPRRG